nr:peroxidase [Aphelinus asychis]
MWIFYWLRGQIYFYRSAGGVMAGSVATLAVLCVFLQTMGLFGQQNAIGAYKLPFALENYFSSNKGYVWEPSQSLVVDTGVRAGKRLPAFDVAVLNASVNFATGVLSRTQRVEASLASSALYAKARKRLANRQLDDAALEKAQDALVAVGASAYLSQANCVRFGLSVVDCAKYISTMRLENTPLGSSCAAEQQADCDSNSEYRSLDGSCNNVQNPKWGSAFTAYNRILFPQYADGIQMPRKERGVHALPNARAVSVGLASRSARSDVSRTLALVQWSELVSHDLAHTSARKMVWSGRPIVCCNEDGQWPLPRYIHPDCNAVSVAENDPDYRKHNVRCLDYVRSLPVLNSDCTFGPTEQMNQVSHFLDGSTIYGSTLAASSEIRAYEGGLLRANVINGNEYLPVAQAETISQCDSDNCYLTGDERANAEPQLAALHTIWMREHNRVARKLAGMIPTWSDETVYQEARRIVTAEIQHITYKEWLPLLIGKRFANSVGLGVASNYSEVAYQPYIDPAVSNEVATAALRFPSSLKHTTFSMTDDDRKINDSRRLSDYFYKPRSIESNNVLDGLIRGLATRTAQKMDLHQVVDITNELYKANGAMNLDQISLDIQRGRDHGLPGYNDYRKHCGLRAAKSFDDFLDYVPVEMVKKWRSLYKSTDDVDLVIGGMAERPIEDAMLGPTFRCLISSQFLRTRKSDRFFYDSSDQPKPFTLSQLNSLKKVTLARVFCDNGDNIEKMQPNVFLKLQAGNEMRACTDFEAIPSIDLFAWAEKAKAYR